jgi:hypothetical protein
MKTTMMPLDDIYIELKQRGLCQSRLGFVEDWIGVHANYLSRVKHRKTPPALSTMFKLYSKLLDRYQPDLAEVVRLQMLARVK